MPVVTHPRNRTLRTLLQVLIPAMLAVPALLAEAGITPRDVPVVGGVLAGVVIVATALARLMALPTVEALLRRWAPWLAAADTQPVPVWVPTTGPIGAFTASNAVPMTAPPTMTPTPIPGTLLPPTSPEPPTPPAAA